MRIIPIIAILVLALGQSSTAQVMLTMESDNASPTVGSEIVVSFNTTGFTDILSIQFSLSWDPSVVEITPPGEVNDNMLPGPTTPVFNELSPGSAIFAWFDMASIGATFLDNTSAFKLKWTAIAEGNPNIQISDTPIPVEFGNLMGPLPGSIDDSAIQSIQVQAGIPTMGQWSLFVLALCFSCISLITLYNCQSHQRTVA